MDTKSKMIPGPWKAQLSDNVGRGWEVIDKRSDNGDIIAAIDPDDILTELGHSNEKTAQAIASVPDLIEALEEIIEYPLNVEGYNSLDAVRLRFVDMQTIARAALAKAGA
jgi:hypothetical protein